MCYLVELQLQRVNVFISCMVYSSVFCFSLELHFRCCNSGVRCKRPNKPCFEREWVWHPQICGAVGASRICIWRTPDAVCLWYIFVPVGFMVKAFHTGHERLYLIPVMVKGKRKWRQVLWTGQSSYNCQDASLFETLVGWCDQRTDKSEENLRDVTKTPTLAQESGVQNNGNN